MPQITVISFGYLHGEPPEAHVTLDLRAHFRDPHFDPALKNLSARDAEVTDAVLATPGIPVLIDAAARIAGAYCSGPSASDHQLVIAVGCSGGRHRAATVAAELYNILSVRSYSVRIAHRDLSKPPFER